MISLLRVLPYNLCLLLLLLSACAAPHKTPTPTTLQPPQKHPLDKSQYRRLILENQMKVLLVSDPSFNKSAVAAQVGVGSMADPPQRQGLAHFLEHMLFLGTEKYPEVDAYMNYISENGGYRNAGTGLDYTTYYFEINHNAFKGGLDQLSQFFIAPLFTTEYTERELNAVHSEHQKNLENDARRRWQVQRTLYRDDHPLHGFSTGNLETLAETQREELLAFHNTHYSANRISLVLLGKAPLDSLEAWSQQYFSLVKNHALPPLKYASNYLDRKATFRLITVEPIKDLRSLEIEFPLPPTISHFASKPTRLLGSLIGHEGAGSLLSLLKQEGLATRLGAGAQNVAANIAAFSINIELTPLGLERYHDVVRLSLAYIAMLKEQDYPSYYFKEMATKAQLDEIYTNRGEGWGYATSLARKMQYYPLDIIERIPYLYTKEDPAAFAYFLSYLQADNMLVTIQAKGVPTNQTEPYYGTQYTYSEDHTFYQDLLKTSPHPALHLPAPNLFMPQQAQMPTRAVQEGIIPDKILDMDGLLLYHAEDAEFLRPKVTLKYKLRLPQARMSLKHKVLLDLYTECVNESLNELAYPAAQAGLSYAFNSGYEGIYFTISGFDESAGLLFSKVLDHMQTPNINADRFAALLDRAVRGLQNFPKEDAWRQARFYNASMVNSLVYTPADRLTVLQDIQLDDISTFATTLYDSIFIEALAYGNINANDAIKLTHQLKTTLGAQAIDQNATFTQGLLEEIEAETLLNVKQLEVNNSCFWREYLVAANTPQQLAIAHILEGFMQNSFFTEMRTKQQLGYIVWAGPSGQRRNSYLYFAIQSGTHPADVLAARADTFITSYPDQFRTLPAETFTTLKNTAAEELSKKAKSIAEKANRFNAMAFNFAGDFERDKKALAALDNITQEQVAALLERTLSPKTRRMRTILAFAKEHQAMQELVPSFDQIDTWKASRTYR